MQSKKQPTRLRVDLRHWLRRGRRVWTTAFGVAGCVLLLRILGFLEPLELAVLDQFFRWQLTPKNDDRITIISISDEDIKQLGKWPLSDAVLVELINKIKAAQPQAIGLDIYRELPNEPGHAELTRLLETTPMLIGIEKLPDMESPGVDAPNALDSRNQIGFNNIVIDADGKVRRMILYWTLDGVAKTSFSLQLAQLYLQPQGIRPKPSARDPNILQLGQSIFPPLQPNAGPYIDADTQGYQVFANYRQRQFDTISISEFLQQDPSQDAALLRDRIVLIGSTADSLQDFVLTPYSGGNQRSAERMAGVQLQAEFLSQLLDNALGDRPVLATWGWGGEVLWIIVWSVVGSGVGWMLRSPIKTLGATTVLSVGLVAGCYLAFVGGLWVPVVPPLLTLTGSTLAIIAYLAHLREELQKSKEFLSSVINTIPDPIFVKDVNHRWIVLNEAYGQLIGHPTQILIEKSEYDVLPAHQADLFWEQDRLTFQKETEQESEEEFTNANGFTYCIATKRSLHRDSAGNLFLVGVIHDITERKRMEEELRRTTAELAQSNAELRRAGDQLRQIAFHDPLTGLPNRAALETMLTEALKLAETHQKYVVLLFLDLDGFKQVNDTHGHRMGDLLLKAVAQRLLGCLRGSDTVARLGGDEFVVLLPAIAEAQNVVRVADKILQTLGQTFAIEEQAIHVTTSVGIALYPADSQTIEELLAHADAAMYQAKQLGKNQYCFASSMAVSESAHQSSLSNAREDDHS